MVYRDLFGRNAVTEFPLFVGGWVGVDLFFVLSGFLIGGQLWKEYATTGSLGYKTFFIKRSLRIWPLYFFVAITFLIIRGVLNPEWQYSDLYFLSNYLPEGAVQGSWSLATEEQFYLLLPLLILGLAFFKVSSKTGRYLAGAMVLVSPLIRYLVWQRYFNMEAPNVAQELEHIYFPFHTHMDGLFIGVLLANLYEDKISWNQNGNKIGLLLVFGAFVTLILRLKFRILFSYTFLALFFGAALWWSLRARSALARAISFPLFPLIARLSFGIYLIHFQLLHSLTPVIVPHLWFLTPSAQFTVTLVTIYAMTTFAAAITYFYIEVPALKFRDSYLAGRES